jgi:hypothetical protein
MIVKTHFNQKHNYEEINEKYGEYIENKYVNENKFIKQIAKELNYNVHVIKKILSLRNIKLKTRSEIKKALDTKSIHRTLNVNENYFKEWSHEMAYILGFIAADGCILNNKNTMRIASQKRDKEILEKIKEELEFEGEIHERNVTLNGKKYESAILAITSKKIADSLKALGITERKSFSIQMPDSIPEEYIADYIRGYFDGDGSVDVRYPSNSNGVVTKAPQIRTRIISGSKLILEQFREFLVRNGLRNVRITLPSGRNVFTITYSTFDSIKFYRLIYSPNTDLYLKRKKEIFEEGIKLREQLQYRI